MCTIVYCIIYTLCTLYTLHCQAIHCRYTLCITQSILERTTVSERPMIKRERICLIINKFRIRLGPINYSLKKGKSKDKKFFNSETLNKNYIVYFKQKKTYVCCLINIVYKAF